MGDLPKFFGKVPVGTKGQIVIPAEARKAMDIKPGDNVIIISGPGPQKRAFSIFPEDEFSKFLKFFEHMAGLKSEFVKHGKG
jgi:AbrB family looped-hinge helix DNA binding protein